MIYIHKTLQRTRTHLFKNKSDLHKHKIRQKKHQNSTNPHSPQIKDYLKNPAAILEGINPESYLYSSIHKPI